MAFDVAVVDGNVTANIGDNTVTLPSHQADDIFLLFVESNSTDTPAAPSGGWAAVTNSPQNDTGTKLSVFWLRAASGSETNPTILDPGDHSIAAAVRVRGCKTTGNPWNITKGSVAGSGTTTVTVTGDTTTVNGCLIVCGVSTATDTNTGLSNSNWANAALSGITQIINDSDTAGDGGGLIVMYGTQATAGAVGNTTATLSGASRQGHMMIALEPAASSNDTEVTLTKFTLTLDFGAVTASGAEDDPVVASSSIPGFTFRLARKLRAWRNWKPRSGRFN